MRNLSLSQQSSSLRRAMLLGFTLAEIMLFLLFALLLLIGAQADQQEQVNDRWGEIFNESLADYPNEPEALKEFLESVNSTRRPGESVTDTWARIRDYLGRSNFEDTATVTDELNRATEENADLVAKLGAVNDYVDGLVHELNQTRAGATPPCLYTKPANSTDGVRGVSVPVALVDIADGGLIFSDIYLSRLNEPLVDFWGQPYETSEIVEYLETLPLGQSLSISEFRARTAPINAIGESGRGEGRECIFTADYTMDDGVPLSMFTNVFQSYFLPQQRIPRAYGE